jgi:HAD superfamily hydrolase (TIGR01450 family)
MSRLVEAFDHFLIDLDGVVYIGTTAISGSVETIHELRRRGKHVRFITNDPRHDARFYADKLSSMGLETPPEEVLPVAGAVPAYLEAQGELPGLRTHVVGSRELKGYLAERGLEIVEGAAAEQAEVVLVGGSIDFDYEQLKIAGRAARQARYFLVTGVDAAFPMPDGPWPGAGAVAAGIGYMAGRQPVVVGKPEPWLFRAAAETLPPGGRIAMVGDNLDSDILGAQRAGYSTILVLSGHSAQADLDRSDVRPDYVLERLADLLRSELSAS